MPLSTNALTILAQVKSHLGIDASDTSQDGLLEFYINAASEFIEKYTKRRFAKGDYTVKLNGEGMARLFVPIFPIISVASVKVSSLLLSSDSYVFYTDAGEIVYLNGVWPKGSQNIEVIYTGGYVLPSASSGRNLPYDLENACVRLASEVYGKREAEGVKNASAGGLSVNWADEMHESIKAMLNNYRVYHV